MSGSTTAQPKEYENLAYNAPDGGQIGVTSSYKWSFQSTVPTAVSTIVGVNLTSVATTIPISSTVTSSWGFASSTQAQMVLNAVLELQRKGFIN